MIETQNTLTNSEAGFIGIQHAQEIEQVFGKELSERMVEASESTSFLNLLFSDFTTK